MDFDGEAPLLVLNTHVSGWYLTGRVGSSCVEFMVDSGASTTIIQHRVSFGGAVRELSVSIVGS